MIESQDEELESILQMAKEILTKTGRLSPALFIKGEDEEGYFLPLSRWWGEDRHAAMRGIGALLGFGLNASSVLLASDVWTRTSKPGETFEDVKAAHKRYPSLRDDPDAESAVSVTILPKDGVAKGILAIYELVDGKPNYTKELRMDGAEPSQIVIAAVLQQFWRGVRLSEEEIATALETDTIKEFQQQGASFEQVARETAREAGQAIFGVALGERESLLNATDEAGGPS